MTTAIRHYIDTLARDPLRDDLRVTPSGRVVGRFLRCEIDSAFQPIAQLGDAAPRFTAFHALARVHADSGAELSPWNLFSRAATDDELVLLDRRCRVVHTLNFFSTAAPDAELLLNVHPRLLSAVATDHGHAFRRVLDSLEIPAARVVIVLPALPADHLDLISHVLASYRLHGFRVAVTLTAPALLDALFARLRADLVRVDAHLLARSGWQAAIAAARNAGSEVLATRVEDEAQRRLAQVAGATHWQGWLLARPATVLPVEATLA